MMDDDKLAQIIQKLDLLIKVTALNILAGKILTQQVEALDMAGLTPNQIANVLGKAPNTNTSITSRLRKKGSGI